MRRLAFGISLVCEQSLLLVALIDKDTLADLKVDDFQDSLIRETLGATKRYSEKPNKGDLAILRKNFRLLWGIEGEGKILDLLKAKVRCETNEANSRRELMSLVQKCHRPRQPMAWSEALAAAKKSG